MKHILMVIVFLTVSGVGAPESYACTCSGPIMMLKLKLLKGTVCDVSLECSKSSSGAIFLGKVLRVKKEETGEYGSSYGVRVTFEVERYWKGVADSEAVIYTSPPGNGSCGFPFRKGQSYIVFANELENRLVTSGCSLTAKSRYAANIVKGLALGEGNVPLKKPIAEGEHDASW